MAKAKTSKKQKASSKKVQLKPKQLKIKRSSGIDLYDPTDKLLDEEKIGRAIWDCLKEGDAEGVIEIVQIHLEAVNKTKLTEEMNIPKTTLYHALRSKNPTLKTLAKLIHASI